MQPALQICLGSMAVNSAHWPVGPLCRSTPVCLLIAETKCPMSTSLLRGTSYAFYDTTTSNHNWCGAVTAFCRCSYPGRGACGRAGRRTPICCAVALKTFLMLMHALSCLDLSRAPVSAHLFCSGACGLTCPPGAFCDDARCTCLSREWHQASACSRKC